MSAIFTAFGDFTRFSLHVLGMIPRRRYSLRSLLDQMYRVGVDSLTVVMFCAFGIGMVMVLQSAYILARYGAKAQVATLVSASFVREIGPVFTAIVFAGRVGTGISAELGTMTVTEQIDAYRAFGTDPVARLATPRVLASAIMLPALTVVATVIGIFSGFIIAVIELEVSADVYLHKSIEKLTRLDIASCLSKALIFGILIGLISTYQGFRTPRMAEAVGRSTTQTMVLCVLAILASDVVLTKIFLVVGG